MARKKAKPAIPPPGAMTVPAGEIEPAGFGLGGVGRDLESRSIVPGPFTSRATPAGEALQELADSVRTSGVLQPVIVRSRPAAAEDGGAPYELIAGERRWRAAQIAGLPTIPAIVRDVDDELAYRIALAENLQREPLNPIEEAVGMQQLVDRGKTHEVIATLLGKSRPWVSNRLRLLELPARWQQWLSQGTIGERQARLVLPYVDKPLLLGEIQEALEDYLANVEEAPTLDVFEREIIAGVLRRRAAKAGGEVFGDQKPSEAAADSGDRPGQAVDSIVPEVAEARDPDDPDELEASDPESDEDREAASGGRGSGPEEDAGAGVDDTAVQFAARLRGWQENWLRYLVADELCTRAGADDVLRVALCAVILWDVHTAALGGQAGTWDVVAEYVPAKHQRQLADAVIHADPARLDAFAGKLLARLFWAQDGARDVVPPKDVARVAELLSVDLSDAWLREQAGPLSAAYWELHCREQLVELARELRVKEIDPKDSRRKMIEKFLARKPGEDDQEVGLPLPKELRRLARKA